MKRWGDDSLPMRAAELREQGRRRRGRPRLRWEDCVKGDVRKAGEEEDCKKKTRYRVGSTSPLTKEKEEERKRATFFFGSNSIICFAADDDAQRCRGKLG